MANKNPHPFESVRTPYTRHSGCKIVESATRTGAQVAGPIPLPTERSLYTIIRATHKYKDSREQFEMRTHKRLIDIINPTQKQLTL